MLEPVVAVLGVTPLGAGVGVPPTLKSSGRTLEPNLTVVV